MLTFKSKWFMFDRVYIKQVWMRMLKQVIEILQICLQISDCSDWDEHTQLLGAIAEFDSMAVVTVITQLEESFGLCIDDDEISAEIFETVGQLTTFVQARC